MKKAKNKYIPPELEIIVFESDDIMSTSAEGGGFVPNDPDYVPDSNVDMPW